MINIYDTLDSGVLKKPGQYYLTDVYLVSYSSPDGSNTADRVSILNLIGELNIYESIYNKTLSGSLFLIDTQNIVGKLPLTGNERLEFKLTTPSSIYGYDFTEKTGHPMYVYKVESRTGVNPRSQAYFIHFCSKEMMTNELIAIGNAQEESYDNIIGNIVKNPDFLNSAKNLFYEPTVGYHKEVFTRIRPFDAIDNISIKTRSQRFYNSGYYFYETSRGFNFRSLENMMAVAANTARPSVALFRPKPMNIATPGGEKDIKGEMQAVMDFQILDQFDTLKNLRNGIFCNKLITHDQLYKTYNEYIFNYFDDYPNSFHTEYNIKDGTKDDSRGILPFYIRDGLTLADFPESTLYFKSQTNSLHYINNDVKTPVEVPPQNEILQRRLTQRLALKTLRVQITVNGFTGIQAGDIVSFEMPSYTPANDIEPSDNDPYMSGRYLVTSVRHQVNIANQKHIMSLELQKDSVRRPYPQELNDTFRDKEKYIDGMVDLYDFDDILLNAEDTGSNFSI